MVQTVIPKPMWITDTIMGLVILILMIGEDRRMVVPQLT